MDERGQVTKKGSLPISTEEMAQAVKRFSI